MIGLLQRLDGCWFGKASARRPALLRVLVGVYTLHYLARRYRMLMQIARSDPRMFKPVGATRPLDKPVPASVFRAVLAATLLAGVAFTLGWRYQRTGPLFAGLLL